MDVLGVFAKYWQPGTVKTRLAAAIGHPAASDLSREFLATIVGRFSRGDWSPFLVFTPAARQPEFQELLGERAGGVDWRCEPQCEGDLGQRLASFFAAAFARGAERVVVMGSDSPTLPEASVAEAFAALRSSDVVLGPTEDGGYYLVGASRCEPPIFHDMPWSTSALWQSTIDRLQAAGWRYAALPEWYDVDEYADLTRLNAELSASPAIYAPLWARVREALSSGGEKLP